VPGPSKWKCVRTDASRASSDSPLPPSRCIYVTVIHAELGELLSAFEAHQRIEGLKLFDGLQLVARAASGQSFPLALAEGSTNRYVGRGVPSGSYMVEVVDPRHRTTSIEGVLPGEVAEVLHCDLSRGCEPSRDLQLDSEQRQLPYSNPRRLDRDECAVVQRIVDHRKVVEDE